MPQLDRYLISSEIFWFIVCFIFSYCFIYCLLLALFRGARVRSTFFMFNYTNFLNLKSESFLLKFRMAALSEIRLLSILKARSYVYRECRLISVIDAKVSMFLRQTMAKERRKNRQQERALDLLFFSDSLFLHKFFLLCQSQDFTDLPEVYDVN